ncbi:oligosaccharide flippase family protein [Marinobacter sp. M1N3S26]|uniref:oligosaccharide flippase family protein n=1 Tax=unclassified Marinobacter TaxID=83889 RepID=UPI00387AB320
MSTTANRVLKSSAFLLMAKGVQRSIGLVSILVLARILTPDDFSIVAISALLLYFCETLAATGSESYIIHKDDVASSDLSTAWTIDLIIKSAIFLLLVIAIPFIADFYEDQRLVPVLYATSSILLINALKSPGLIALKRQLDYRRIFFVMITQKVCAFTVTLSIALTTESYWALIIGDITSASVLCLGSYLIHPFRPRPCLANWRNQWRFSKWILFRASVGFSKSQMDSLLISKFFSAQELGAFYMTKNLSVLPSTDIIGPAVEPLLASLSRVRDDLQEFNQQLSKAIFVITSIIMPIVVFMWWFPDHIINFFFGPEWAIAYPMLPPLAVVLATIAFGQIINQAIMSLGRVKALFIFEIIGLVMLTTALFLSRNLEIRHFIEVRSLFAVGLVLGIIAFLRYCTGIRILRLAALISPTILLAILAAWLTGEVETRLAIELNSFSVFPVAVLYFGLFIPAFLLILVTVYQRYDEGAFALKTLGNIVRGLWARILHKSG